MFWMTDDPARDAERLAEAQDRQLEQRPVCSECGHHIQADHYYDINGEVVCPECLENYYRKEVEDYIE